MKVTGIILIVVGVILGVLGFVAPVVGASMAVSKVNSTDSTTYAEGQLTQLLNPGKLLATPASPYDENVPFKQTRLTQANSQAMSEQAAKDAGATVFNTTATTVRTDTGEQLSKDGAVYAFNPADSQLINCCSAALVSYSSDGTATNNTNVNFTGVMPLKFPFGAPQADVQYWNDSLQTTVTAKYVGTENQYGMTLYKYTVSIPPTQTKAEPTAIPAALARGAVTTIAPDLADQVPATGNLELYEWLTAEESYLVEPLSGQIVDGKVDDLTTFRLNNGTKDIVTKVHNVGGSANVEEGAKDIKSSADQLKMVALATPILIGLGVILLIIGIILLVVGGRRKKAAAAASA